MVLKERPHGIYRQNGKVSQEVYTGWVDGCSITAAARINTPATSIASGSSLMLQLDLRSGPPTAGLLQRVS